MSEIQTRFAELIQRLGLLGASDEEIDTFSDDWPDWTEEQQERLFRMGDQDLYAAIAASRDEADYFATADELEDRAMQDVQLRTESEKDDAAWSILSNTVPGVLQLVDEVTPGSHDQRSLAARLARLEATADKPRTGLISRLQVIAGPDYPAGGAASPQEGTQDGSTDAVL